jgi:nitroimidazol reductase NimA-like FMN-containing flavoprotein (pyridoxamine 5'-phosphate oxidase superfamily)
MIQYSSEHNAKCGKSPDHTVIDSIYHSKDKQARNNPEKEVLQGNEKAVMRYHPPQNTQLMGEEDTMRVLAEGEYGILSTVSEEMQPYGVPLSYVYIDKCIYFHSTSAGGSKYSNIQDYKSVCFTVVGKTKVLPDKFGTLYESAIAFGEAELVSDEEERLMVFREFLKKYCAGFLGEGEKYIKAAGSKAMIIKIKVKDLTGKHRV